MIDFLYLLPMLLKIALVCGVAGLAMLSAGVIYWTMITYPPKEKP